MGVINRLNSVHSPVTEFLHRETALSEIGTTRRDRGSYGFLIGLCM